MGAWIVIPATVFGLLFIVIPFIPQPRFSISHLINIILIIVSGFIMVIGVIIAINARLVFRKHSASLIPGKTSSIVDKGVYGVIRHPIYFALLLILFGIYLFMKGIFSLFLMYPLIVETIFVRAYIEEKILEQDFPEYKAYKKRVGMLFPKIRTR